MSDEELKEMTYNQIAKLSVAHERGTKHEEGDLVMWSNGVVARVQADGRHIIFATPPAAADAARQVPRYSKALGAKAAARAFNEYYAQKARTMSPRSLKAAMTRDLCHGKKEKYQRRTTAYKARRNGRLTGPGHYDYPGLDDGSRCPQRGGLNKQVGAGCRLKSTGRCVAAPSERMHPSCELGPRYVRKGKEMPGRCRKIAVKKSPKKAKKSPKKVAKKSPKKARKSPKKKGKRGQGMKGYDYYDPMETRRKPGRRVKGAVGLAAIGYGGKYQ